jgi:hypothetical protein
MNDDKIVHNLIDFIMKKERELLSEKFMTDSKAKKDAVQAILEKLGQEIDDEN